MSRMTAAVILCAAMGPGSRVQGQSPSLPGGDLERLRYNHPGLVVDLGVGLWASPLPMDYDADGDLDLAIGYGDPGLFDAIHWDADSLSFFFNGRFNDNGLDALAFIQTGDSASYDVYLSGFYRPEDIWISASGFHPPLTTPFVLGDDIIGAPQFIPGVDTGIYLWIQELSPIWELRFSASPQSGATGSGVIIPSGSIVDAVVSETEPYVPGVRGTTVWRNDGGTFVDVSATIGITDTVNVRHVAWLDLDQDGWLDLHVLNKGDSQVWNQPDLVYRGGPTGTFTEMAGAWGLGGPENGLADAVAYGDYDSDGDLDVATTSGTGPRYFSRYEEHRLYRNDGPVGNWIALELEGVFSSRPGYGAWITCWSPTIGRQTRYVAGNAWRGSGGVNEPRFGLGPDTTIDELRIEWPSGAVNVLEDVAVNQRLTIVENDPSVDAPSVDAAPQALRLAVGPNPAPGATVLSLHGLGDERARLEIFDSTGRRLLARDLPPGGDRFVWDGRDEAGRRAAPGVYFARVRAGARSDRAKIVRVGR